MISLSKIVRILIAGLVAIALQSTLLKALLPPYLVPNLLLVLVVFLGFYAVRFAMVFVVFLLGLQLDLASGLLLGPWAGAFVVIFLLLAVLSQRIFIESTFTLAVMVFVSSLLADIIYVVLTYRFAPSPEHMVLYTLAGAVTTVIVAPFLFGFFKKLFFRRGVSGAKHSGI